MGSKMIVWIKDEWAAAVEDVTVDPFWLPLGVLAIALVVGALILAC